MNLKQACADCPDAWASIQEQIAEVRAAGLDVVPLHARIINARGVEVLEVIAVADCEVPDSDASAGGISFLAPIVSRPALRVVE